MPASSFDLTNKRERGYLVPGMAIGLVLLSLGCAALWRVAGHEREQRAVAEANARQWQATALECSVATEKAAKAGQEAARKAQAALLAARKGVATTQAEIARLRASQAASCQAAVAEVRKGLK